MEKFRYGPLIYITFGMNDDEGNYYWNGLTPVGYDEMGVPVDKNGDQCLDVSCPIHPAHEPQTTEYCEVLSSELPTLDSFKAWFDNNFLIVTDEQLKRWIIRWWARYTRRTHSELYYHVINKYSSVEEIKEAVWPDATIS